MNLVHIYLDVLKSFKLDRVSKHTFKSETDLLQTLLFNYELLNIDCIIIIMLSLYDLSLDLIKGNI